MEAKLKRTWPTRKRSGFSLLIQMLAPVLLVLILGACAADHSTSVISPSVMVKPENDGFIEGVWVDQWLLKKVKNREMDSAWNSLRNFTYFGTYRNAKGEPSWGATVPDKNGMLIQKGEKWYDGETALLEFQVVGFDTLVQYHFSEMGYQEAGVGPIRIHEKIPRFRAEDTYIPVDWIYQLYYFPGSYVVMVAEGGSFAVGMSQEGELLGMEGYDSYGLDIGNSKPILILGSKGEYEYYVLEWNRKDFSLYEMLNEELDGPDNDIVQGNRKYRFVRKSE
jgi:hypothetical protein